MTAPYMFVAALISTVAIVAQAAVSSSDNTTRDKRTVGLSQAFPLHEDGCFHKPRTGERAYARAGADSRG